MKPVEFHPEANADLASAAAFYQRRGHRLAEDFAAQIAQAIGFIRDRPGAGKPMRGSVRGWVVRRFPYWVVYQEDPAHIYVLAVGHQRQRPGFWYDRS